MKRFLIVLICVIVFLNFVTPINAYYTFMPATTVVGQPDMLSSTSGNASNKLSTLVRGIFVDPNGRLIVADTSNHRVLIWNSIPTTNGVSANLVLGQSDFGLSSANRGGSADANTLSSPSSIWSDGNKVLVADAGNHRVLVWNTFPNQNGQSADLVIGQSTMQSNTASCNSSTLSSPQGIFLFNGKLMISSSGQDRILVWNSFPTANGAAADLEIGQTDINTCTTGRAPAQNTINSPRGIFVDSAGRMYLADRNNRRVLIWNTIPTQSGTTPADIVIGQKTFLTNTSSPSAYTFEGFPIGVFIHKNRLFSSDGKFLIWNTSPTTSAASADVVIGEANFTNSIITFINAGFGFVNSQGFGGNGAGLMHVLDDKTIVADEANSRILIFNNVLSSPIMNINSPLQIDSGKVRIQGNISLGERPNYSMQKVTAKINGENENNVSFLDGGRDNGPGNTLYEFTEDFNPTINGGDSSNYTVAFRAQSFNAEEDKRFYFTPFSFDKITVESYPTISFTVNQKFRSEMQNNLSKYQVWYKKDNDLNWKLYIDSIPVSSENNGNITLKATTKLTKGKYQFQVRAINNMGREQQSNNININLKVVK